MRRIYLDIIKPPARQYGWSVYCTDETCEHFRDKALSYEGAWTIAQAHKKAHAAAITIRGNKPQPRRNEMILSIELTETEYQAVMGTLKTATRPARIPKSYRGTLTDAMMLELLHLQTLLAEAAAGKDTE